MKKWEIPHNSLINNFDIFWYCTGIKHLLTRIKILDFSRLFATLWIQVGIWQCWPKIHPWGSQGWLLLLTQTILVTKFYQKYSFDKKEDLLGYVFCSSFLLVWWWWQIFSFTQWIQINHSSFKNYKNLLKVYCFFLCTEYIKFFQQKKHV